MKTKTNCGCEKGVFCCVAHVTRKRTAYRTADTSTLKGLEYAEWLHAHGWIQYSVGLFIVKFYKRGHCFTVKNGVVYDNGRLSPRYIVRAYAEVKGGRV